jgi:release factor H-coupled RctB family protein
MGNFDFSCKVDVHLMASEASWIEQLAVDQLNQTALWPGMVKAVGLPDLHPGKYHPIGAAFITRDILYPQLVGNDIGCGMGLWQSDLLVKKNKPDRFIKKLGGLQSAWDGDVVAWRAKFDVASSDFDSVMGTIGGGNHFAELQCVEQVIDAKRCAELGLDANRLQVLVHSGSRGLGESVLRDYLQGAKTSEGVAENSPSAQAYLSQHDEAVRWAEANRALIAQRFMTCLGTSGRLLTDVNHNTVTSLQWNGCHGWLHRKGATPSTDGVVVIPGSRGDFSYLVQPIGEQSTNAYSLAHGAGRKWKRSSVKGRLAKFKAEDLRRTNLGSRVICEDKKLLFEEAPPAYKNITTVIDDMVNAGVVRVIAILRPVITYKTRRDE